MTALLFRLDGLRRGPMAEAVSPAWLLVADGIVCHAGATPPTEAPPYVHFAQGGWAIEPLADAHVHLALPRSVRRDGEGREGLSEREDALGRVLGLLEAYRRQGIGAVRDGGDPSGLTLEAAPLANGRPDRYASLLPCGWPVRRRGRYGGFLGEGVDDVGGAVRLLRRNRRLGATHAKIIATGLNSVDRAGEVGEPQFSPQELASICQEAWGLGMPPMVHANGPLASILGAVPGTVEHGFWLETADLRQMAETKIPWVPTLGAWAELETLPGLSAPQRAVVRETDLRHRDEVYRGRQAGVTVLAGSDAGSPGVPHDRGLYREIGRLRGAGMALGAALATATWDARRLCERELGRPLGGLEVGAVAGFLWLGADPVKSPAPCSRPLGVHLGGRWSPVGSAQRMAPMTLAEVHSRTEETR